MPSTLTFGIELEFLLAYLPDDVDPPDLFDKRILHFPSTDDNFSLTDYYDFSEDLPSTRTDDKNGSQLMSAIKQIRIALKEVGLHVVDKRTDYSGWGITEDTSIDKPEDSPYSFFQLELRSPAYYFAPEALQEVMLAIKTLTEKFRLLTVPSSALHVHVGDGNHSFDFETTKKLAAFLWAFEPQLHSIHPQDRQSFYFARDLRATSVYATGYRRKYDRDPDGITGALDLLACEDIGDLGEKVRDNDGFMKHAQVNFEDVVLAASSTDYPKKTIEWRQHKGTLDGDEICNWISTVVGIMYFVRDAPEGYFLSILSLATNEKWQKLGDGKDDAREAEHGPILAESHFTISDLLRVLMLDDEAEFYRDRWHVLTTAPLFPPHRSRTIWDYEQEFPPESEDYVQYQALRQIWEDIRILKDVAGSTLLFDPDHTMWPSHRAYETPPQTEFEDEDDES